MYNEQQQEKPVANSALGSTQTENRLKRKQTVATKHRRLSRPGRRSQKTTNATNRLVLTFSKKERLAIQERLQEQHVFINATNSVASLENELDFLHPDLSICENIFEMSPNKSEFAYIWWELDKYARVLADMTTELETKGRTLPRQCFEGYSHRYPGESQMMAKLAR